MARPKKAPDDKLSEAIQVRLTPEQLAKVDELSERYGLNRSSYLRELAVTGEVRIHMIPELNREAITELRKIGGLLAALMKKFPTEAEDLQALRQRAHHLAAHLAGLDES